MGRGEKGRFHEKMQGLQVGRSERRERSGCPGKWEVRMPGRRGEGARNGMCASLQAGEGGLI